MLIDSHCHLDFLDSPEVPGGIAGVLARSRQAGVSAIVVPAVSPENFDRVALLADREPEVFFALGIHPMYVEGLSDAALIDLHNALDRFRHHPKLVAVGEIGLDHHVPGLNREKMLQFLIAQCRLARDAELPVVLHVRKAQDQVLAVLRRFGIRHGIAHAFNGSDSQADAYCRQGLRLGFGGAMTFARAHRLHRLAIRLPLESLVLETDAPDIPPAWMAQGEGNEPAQLARIADHLAGLRSIHSADVIRQTAVAACDSLPVLGRYRQILSDETSGPAGR